MWLQKDQTVIHLDILLTQSTCTCWQIKHHWDLICWQVQKKASSFYWPIAECLTAILLAEDWQKHLTILATAFARTDDPLREDLVCHQCMEHNYGYAVGPLEELESDLAYLKDIQSHTPRKCKRNSVSSTQRCSKVTTMSACMSMRWNCGHHPMNHKLVKQFNITQFPWLYWSPTIHVLCLFLTPSASC